MFNIRSLFVFTFFLTYFTLCKSSINGINTNENHATSSIFSNNYPIILVHGVAGWGRDEMIGFKYWGALKGDLEGTLQKKGYRVHTPAMGPFSSNWDRACELYTQIKGGRVDYGIEHSRLHKHKRYGRYYKGFYPEWGTKDENGNIRKVHIIAHSMGGTTARLLSQLLANGSTGSDTLESKSEGIIWEGGHADWIQSISTFATPHDGTTFADGVATFGSRAVQRLFAAFASVFNVFGSFSKSVYDLKMDQFDIGSKQTGESFKEYYKRVSSSSLFNLQGDFRDTALHSLSTKGSRELNGWVKLHPEIYYFSYSNWDTHKTWTFYSGGRWFTNVQRPNYLSMFAPLQPVSAFMGGNFPIQNGFDDVWQRNDGAINWISSGSPTLNSTDQRVEFTGNVTKGIWNHVLSVEMCHLAMTGWTIIKKPFPMYFNHINILMALEHHEKGRRLNEKEDVSGGGVILSNDLVSKVKNTGREINEDKYKITSLTQLKEQCNQLQASKENKFYCDTMVEANKSSLEWYHIVLISTGCVAALALVVFIIRKRKSKKSSEDIVVTPTLRGNDDSYI